VKGGDNAKSGLCPENSQWRRRKSMQGAMKKESADRKFSAAAVSEPPGPAGAMPEPRPGQGRKTRQCLPWRIGGDVLLFGKQTL